MVDEPDKEPIRNREKFFDWKSLLLVGGALLWAASQNWISMAEFFQSVLDQWKNFLRAIWADLFFRLNIDVFREDHQRDILSLLSIFLFSGVIRYFFKIKSAPLFAPNFKEFARQNADRFSKEVGRRIQSDDTEILRIMKGLLYAVISIALFFLFFTMYLMVIIPFTDTVAFTHEYLFLTELVRFATMAFGVFQIAKLVFDLRKVRWPSRHAVISFLKSFGIFLIACVTLSVVFAVAWSVFGLSALFENFDFMSQSFDDEPFELVKFITNIRGESGADLILIFFCLFALFLASGRSMRLILQFLVIGICIVFVGWFSGVVLNYGNGESENYQTINRSSAGMVAEIKPPPRTRVSSSAE